MQRKPNAETAGQAAGASRPRIAFAPGHDDQPRVWWGCPLPTATAWEDGRPTEAIEPADGWWTQDRCGELLVWLELIKPTLIDLLARPDRAAERRADREWLAVRRNRGKAARSLRDALRTRPQADRAWLADAEASARRVGEQLRGLLVAQHPPAARWPLTRMVAALANSPSVLTRLWEAGWIDRPSHLMPPAHVVAMVKRPPNATYETSPSSHEDLFR